MLSTVLLRARTRLSELFFIEHEHEQNKYSLSTLTALGASFTEFCLHYVKFD